jgi:tetratricopeptide (TPR) repeat protein
LVSELTNEALAAVVTRLTVAEQLEPMVTLVEQHTPTLTDGELANRLRLRAALACIDGLGDYARAAKLLEAAVVADPTSDEALTALRDAYACMGNWTGLRDVRLRQLDLATDVEERVALLTELADLDANSLQDFPSAAERYQRVLELDPTNRRALEALEALYRALAQWDRLVVVLQRRVELEPTAAECVAVYGMIAEVYRGPLADNAAAAQAYRVAIERCGDDPALARQRQAMQQAMQQALEACGG